MSILARYSIKDLETLSGVKSHTIRIWEKRYGLLQPERSGTNIRAYSNEDLKKLLNISFLNRSGLKISKIATLNRDEIAQKVLALNVAGTEEDHVLEGLLLALIDMNERQFLRILNTQMMQLGFERAITEVVFPFFEHIGVMWQTGTINPAQEHFISNLVRQKIISATDVLDYQPDPALPKIVLLLPENELHEISLLLYNYSLRFRGFPTFYLGQAVPMDSLDRVVQILQPDVLVCSVVSSLNISELNPVFAAMEQLFSGMVLISGNGLENPECVLPRTFQQFNNLDQLLGALSGIVNVK